MSRDIEMAPSGHPMVRLGSMADKKAATWSPIEIRPLEKCGCSSECEYQYVRMTYHYRCPWCGTINHSESDSAGWIRDGRLVMNRGECNTCYRCGHHEMLHLDGLEEYVNANVRIDPSAEAGPKKEAPSYEQETDDEEEEEDGDDR